MTDKLKASVTCEHDTYRAELRIGGGLLKLGVVWQYDQRGWAKDAADTVTRAIAQHDKAVHPELIAQCHRLAAALRDLHDEQNGPPMYSRTISWKAAMNEARDALAEVEKSGCVIAPNAT